MEGSSSPQNFHSKLFILPLFIQTQVVLTLNYSLWIFRCETQKMLKE